MAASVYSYCTTCGSRGDAATSRCKQCGAQRELSRDQHRSGVAFLLNELSAFPMSQVLTIQQRSRVESHYEGALTNLGGAAPAVAYVAPVLQPPPIAQPAPRPQAPVAARQAPPPRPKRDFDWSWLAEQQANLFLFAGAFLTVVAALIYVGYSGEAVSGGLKMALLSTYTLAFLAAGDLCTRIKRVATAGRVFFGVGAILVPLNFVAARTIFGEEQFSAESMWLLGSLATAAFYTAVAYIGLGRAYAFSAGTALGSATLATVVVAEVPFEWAPVLFVGLAMVMSLSSIAGPARLRERIGTIWTLQAHALAAASAMATILIALISQEGSVSEEITSAWFLPLTFAGLALYASIHMLATREAGAGIAAIAGFGIAFVAIIFATDAPVEYYAVILGALAVIFGGALIAINESGQADRLPKQFDEMLRVAGIIATGAALLVGLLVLEATHGAEATYSLHSRWFVTATFALMLPFYAADAFVRRERTGVAGLMTAAAGASVGVVFGFDLSVEYYAFGLMLPALLIAVASRWGKHPLLERLHSEWRNDAFILGYIAVAAAVVTGCLAALAGVQAQSDELLSTTYEPQFRAFLPLVWLGAIIFAAIDASRGKRYGVIACALSVLAIGGAVTYVFDPSVEYYAFGFVAAALVLGFAARFARDPEGFTLDQFWREDAFNAGRIGAAAALMIALAAVAVATDATPGSYEPVTRWFLPGVLALATVFAALDASRGERLGLIATGCSFVGFGASLVYALDASAEFYAIGVIAPALALAASARFAPNPRAFKLDASWRDDAFNVGRVAVIVALGVAGGALLAANDTALTYAPATRWFLPAAFGLAGVFAAFDASRGRRVETSAAVFAAIIATALSVMYAFDAAPAYYGATLAGTSIGLAVVGRMWTPGWLDERVRDAFAAAGVTASWLLFDGVYREEARIGASVHLAAAFFYAMAAITDRSSATLQRFIDTSQVAGIKVASGWLYASGFTAVVAFIYVLVSLPDGASAYGLPLANTFALVAFAFAGVGVVTKGWRPDFRAHLYVMSLAAAVVALAAGPSAGLLTVALVAYIVLYLAVAVLEDQPLIAVPSAVFGFAAVAAWREHADAAWSFIPASYSLIAIASAAVVVLLSDRRRAWAYGLGGGAATYAVVAPIVGFLLLADQMDDVTGLVNGEDFYRTALYQVSTISVAVCGVLALAAALALGRRWIIVPASAVLTIALLLQIGHYNPSNPQAYTVVIGAYLVGLGMLGLWKFRLVPELEDLAPFVEGLGAAIIMLPSFIQSLDGGWRYQWILLAEAMVFLTASIILRRRGMLAAAFSAMVLVAGRALVDAANALPNWMIVAVAGSALLAIGMGILIGRDRWSAWQEGLIGWWDEAGKEPPVA